MFCALFAIGLFALSVIVHILYCRRLVQRKLHIKAYSYIAFIFLSVYVLGVLILRHEGLPFPMTAGVIFVLLIPTYLIFYILTQFISPSQKILSVLAHRQKLSYADIVACVEKEGFITTRLDDLCASGCVVQIKGGYLLSPSGKRIAAVLNLMQHVFGRGIGG